MVEEQRWWLRKGNFLRSAFDEVYENEAVRDERYREALALLNDEDMKLWEMTSSWSPPQSRQFTDGDREHFRKDWLENTLFGADEAYCRAAFKQAIEHAMERGVPLEAIWVTAGNDRVQIGWVDNPNSVMIVILTRVGRKDVGPGLAIDDPYTTQGPRL